MATTTQLLIDARSGTTEARSALFAHLYEHLRRAARGQLRKSPGASFQTTELINEAYLKLCDAQRLEARDRTHFVALSARVMRQVLVDHFRARTAGKRGGATPPLSLDEGLVASHDRGKIVLDLDEALRALENLRPRTARVVELKFFGGMTEPEIAEEIEASVRTVSDEWRRARAFLTRELRR